MESNVRISVTGCAVRSAGICMEPVFVSKPRNTSIRCNSRGIGSKKIIPVIFPICSWLSS